MIAGPRLGRRDRGGVRQQRRLRRRRAGARVPPLRLRAPARRRRRRPRPARLAPPPLLGPRATRADAVAARRADAQRADRGAGARAVRRSRCWCCSRSSPCRSGGSCPACALFEWVGLLGLTAVYARGSGRPLALGAAPAQAVAGRGGGRGADRRVGLAGGRRCSSSGCCRAPKEVDGAACASVIAPAEGRRGFALALLLIAVTPAICEEALFRGPILRGLRTPALAARRGGR